MKRKVFSLFLMMFLVIGFWAVLSNFTVSGVAGIGDIKYEDSREIAPGVMYTNTISKNSDWQRGFQLEYDPKTAGVETRAVYGNQVWDRGVQYDRNTLSQEIALMESKGEMVFAGFNGDYYDMNLGIPIGMVMSNGRVITANGGVGYPTLGYKSNGEVVLAKPNLNITYSINGGTAQTIHRLNRSIPHETTMCWMQTRDFGSSSMSVTNITEVVLDISSGDIIIGGVINATVASVNIDVRNTPIGTNQMLLIGHEFKTNGIKVGDSVVVTLDETTGLWADVKEAISAGGSSNMMLENGIVASGLDTALNPQTLFGVKADGTVVVYINDGRAPGTSGGISVVEAANYMLAIGCVNAVRLDGGGSSTMAVRLPGENSCKVVNTPSDGGERRNANSMLLIAKVKTAGSFSKLHAYPGQMLILTKTVVNLSVLATDANFIKVTTPSISYTTETTIGSVSATGIFTASSSAGSGKIVVSSGSVYTEIDVVVIDDIDEIQLDSNNLPMGLNDTRSVKAYGVYDGLIVMCSNEAFTWTLDPVDLGTINNGTFTSGNTPGVKGNIIVSYKSVSKTCIVTVGTLPELIDDFETASVGAGAGQYRATLLNGALATLAINDDERYVKFGYQSLRVDFDLTQSSGTGDASIGRVGNIPIPGTATHIGMWVYGDFCQGAWLRMMVQPTSGSIQYIDISSKVDWTGWKYVEAVLEPSWAPATITQVFRVLATTPEQRIKGTVFVDGIRAVYGFRNDDMVNPYIGEVTPAQSEKILTPEPIISAQLFDLETGINKDKTRMWLNGDEIPFEALTFNNLDNGFRVNYVPNVLTWLAPGSHKVKVRAEDYFGNFITKEWTFSVNADTVELFTVVPDDFILYSGQVANYKIYSDKYVDFAKYTLEIDYNKDSIEIRNIKFPEGVEVLTNTINTTSGKLTIVLQDIYNCSYDENIPLVDIEFRVRADFNGEASFNVVKSLVKDNKLADEINMYVDNMSIVVQYKYSLGYSGSTVNSPIVLYVYDGSNKIAGASILNDKGLTVTGVTNSNGELTTNVLTSLSVGTVIVIQAIVDGIYSEKVNFVIYESLGSVVPDFVIIASGEDPSTSMRFGWMTNVYTKETVIVYGEKSGTSMEILSPITISSGEIEYINIGGREILSHHIELYNLKPNTTYVYKVGDGTTFSDVKEFKTAPSLGEAFSILYFSDPQSASLAGYDPLLNIYNHALNIRPGLTMAIASGDISDNADNYSYWQYFYQKLGGMVSSIPTSYGSGNHELSNYPAFSGMFNNPKNGVEGLEGTNYYVEVSNIIIAFINTEMISHIEAQRLWLIEIMNNTKAEFKIVVMHQGPYSIFYANGQFRSLNSTFEDLGVNLVLTGHDHIYNRTISNGVTYVVGGSSGGKFYDATEVASWPVVIYDDNNPVFGIMDFENLKLTFTMYALTSGSINQIDKFEITVLANYEKVINYIDDIGIVSLASNEKIEKALFEYNRLSENDKLKVNNYQVLVDAQNKYNELVLEALDKEEAKRVDLLILNIGEISLDKEDLIILAREEYDLLTSNQKSFVEKYQVLLDAEEEYEKLLNDEIDEEKAAYVDMLILSIGVVSLNSGGLIEEIFEEYMLLSTTQKALVKNFEILALALEEYNTLILVKEVVDLIDSIGDVSLDKKEQIEKVRSDYNNLTSTQKDLVTNLSILLAAEIVLNDYIKADEVDQLIDTIGTITLDKKELIESIRDKYNSLTEDQKLLVLKLLELEHAEEELIKLAIESGCLEGCKKPISETILLFFGSLSFLGVVLFVFRREYI